jgi:chromosomal replication initiation ATPase DnaA
VGAAKKKHPFDMRIHMGVLAKIGVLEALERICREHNVLLSAVLSPNKSKRIVQARAACCVHLRSLEMSYPEVGKVMLRDHSAVMGLVKKSRGEQGKEGDDGTEDTPSA